MGFNPIEELISLQRMAVEAFKTGRGYGETGDAGTAYLAVAVRATETLARFKHPTLQAIAIKDMTEGAEGRVAMNTAEALKVMAMDPFAKPVREVTTEQVLMAKKLGPNDPMLSCGQVKLEEEVAKELKGK